MANNDLNQIRIFVKVAQLKSFTKAAVNLGVEKSTISSKVTQLESRLGIRLLQRTTRSVSLTEAGEQYLSYCEQALAALQMGDDFIAGLSQTPTGQLRISVPHNLAEFLMPTVITPFLQQYTQVSLEIIQSSRQVNLVAENFDIALRTSSTPLQDSSLICRKIYSANLTLVASHEHIARYGLAQTPADLLGQPSVGVANESNPQRAKYEITWQGTKIALKHRFAVNNMNCVKMAVKAGLGFGLLSKNMVRKEIAQQQLVEIADDIDIPATSLYVVYPTRSGQPAKLKAFISALLEWGAMMAPEKE
jgi:DNA-binding transcriptional LysR family regulator